MLLPIVSALLRHGIKKSKSISKESSLMCLISVLKLTMKNQKTRRLKVNKLKAIFLDSYNQTTEEECGHLVYNLFQTYLSTFRKILSPITLLSFLLLFLSLWVMITHLFRILSGEKHFLL